MHAKRCPRYSASWASFSSSNTYSNKTTYPTDVTPSVGFLIAIFFRKEVDIMTQWLVAVLFVLAAYLIARALTPWSIRLAPRIGADYRPAVTDWQYYFKGYKSAADRAFRDAVKDSILAELVPDP